MPCRRPVPFAVLLAACIAAGPTTKPASGPAADPAVAAIRDQGLNHSEVMATLDTLCNVIGPRLTASPGQRHASEWTRDELARWGLSNAHLEPWGPFGRGWDTEWFTMQIVSPYTVRLTGVPKAWSPGFDRPIEADVIYLEARTRDDLSQYKGKLRGKIVLLGRPRPVSAHFDPQAVRMDDDELARLAKVGAGRDIGVEELMRPPGGRFAATGPAAGPRPPAASAPTTRSLGLGRGAARLFQPQALAFLLDEGAALVIDPSSGGDGGTVYVAQASLPSAGDPRGATTGPTTGPASRPTTAAAQAAGASPGGPTASPAAIAAFRSYAARPRVWSVDAPPTVPQVTMADEDYARLVSLLAHGQPVRAAVDLRVKFYPPEQTLPANTVAELPGTDLKDQIVMCGGHLDSWHGGTGATDNGVGAAAAMEAIRIIKAAGLHPRRTIRVALWTGEEQGLYGSSAYVKAHFGYLPDAADPTTRPATAPATGPTTRRPRTRRSPTPALVKGPEYEKLAAYFNLDNGTGKVRGLYAQSNPAAAVLFRRWLAPVADLGAGTVTLADTGSTDHESFDDIGLPGFQFIQDPIEYGTRTHHSTADVYDRIQPDDMRQSSTVMALMLWDAANTDDRFPRKPLAAKPRF